MKTKPLALSLRPSTIKDIFGQKHLLNEKGIIARIAATKKVFSLIFYGKPGVGKTSLALALANDLKMPYKIFNASTDEKKVLTDIIATAKVSANYILIVEEIHRLNKDKQDILLSGLENGTFVMFATTTENPFFVINPAIRSRCQILQLQPLNLTETFACLKTIVKNSQMKNVSNAILQIIATKTLGDIRAAINTIDLIFHLYRDVKITKAVLDNLMNQVYVTNAHYGDEFHNLKSALHKSLRGSDVDAALHYLGRLILSGDLVSISRRMQMVAYEDIGLANPNLCIRVYLGLQAAKEVGFPEAAIILGNLAIEMALSPKSNSAYLAMKNASTDIMNGNIPPIPKHLCDGHYKSSAKLGIIGYKYPHDYSDGWIKQQYLPEELQNAKYYYPAKHSANETKLASWLKSLQKGNK